MLIDLQRYFTTMGWYVGTHTFITMRLEGGFEAFSGRASETWEYRWIIEIHENQKLKIPAVLVKGGRFEDIDEVAKRVLRKLKANDKG